MSCKGRTRVLVVALATLATLLSVPSTGLAATGERDLLAPGAGYATPQGAAEVRHVQRLLRRLGDAPGPIDGLYGPLTAAAVRRFQGGHALAADGVVGPLTRSRLAAERAQLHKARLERKSPARVERAESVPEPSSRNPANAEPTRAAPSEAPSDRTPWIAGVVGGLALVLLLVVLWRLASLRTDPRLGLVCAALLATFAIGAATGAVFASHAAPNRGAKPSAATAEPGPR
jgi:peptidoglycan hydrolase-like protein with peptidoglycan-binding domain